MRERDAFITFINEFKTVSPTITDQQRIGLLQRAVQQHGLSVDEASEILNAARIIVGEKDNYFEVLGISIEQIHELDDQTFVNIVKAAHDKHYRASLTAGARIRPDGKTEEQWRTILNQARDTLIDPQKRNAYLDTFLSEENTYETPTDDIQHINTESQPTEPNTAEPIIPEESTVPTRQNVNNNVIPESIQLITDIPDNMTLIPAGEFRMGSNEEKANEREKPAHTVYIDAFCIDKYLVTNAQYKEFIDENPQWRKPQWFKKHISIVHHNGSYLRHWSGDDFPDGKDDHPVTRVSWYAAMAYSQWVGKRLPTEAEWEKAARGGLEGKKYPWGDAIGRGKANYFYHTRGTTPVGRYPSNRYDLYDMCGNVWEWCLDAYNAEFYASSPHRNPYSDEKNIEWVTINYKNIKTTRVLRGGSWSVDAQGARVAYRFRSNPADTLPIFGFRCVKEVTL